MLDLGIIYTSKAIVARKSLCVCTCRLFILLNPAKIARHRAVIVQCLLDIREMSSDEV